MVILDQVTSFGLFGIYLLILGILKEDMFLRIAIFGPILIAAAGIFLLMLTIDIRHGLSSALQSTISSFVPYDIQRTLKVAKFFTSFTGLNFAWISTIFLPRNAPSFSEFSYSALPQFYLCLSERQSQNLRIFSQLISSGQNL